MPLQHVPSRIIIGTRMSAMAMAQTATVVGRLRRAHPGLATHLARITTTADQHLGSLDAVGGKAAWVRELDAALVAGRADLTVSCAKDLPGPRERGSDVVIGAVLPRQDARDAVVLPAGVPPVPLRDLAPGSVLGTIAPRRAAQLRALFPHLVVQSLRGNLDTRIKRLDEGNAGLDALVVSCAGLERLGLLDRAAEVLPADVILPATGAGFVVVERRAGDKIATELLREINDPAAERLLRIERGVLGAIGGDCHTACSVHAVYDESNTQVKITAAVFDPLGGAAVKADVIRGVGDDQAVIDEVAQRLRDGGATALLSPA
ncbi:hydroxymethylbilane synthase [Streptomyces sp. NPDC058471]|uniref:hydroxymethylbilane synthase n=1 Tax=Streptomyces sp. NPDC058471 TaxID=3346516 RepID=UPI0036522D24